MRRILSNLGFVLQVAGIFMIFPLIAGFLYQEYTSIIALFITAFAFLVLGFFLNSLCERKEMNSRQSASLFFLVFLLLGLIGSIPYLYIGFPGQGILERITNSIFESMSGFTTTGFSFLTDLDNLPKSIIFYRALTQFIGGIGIVLVLLAFFYPEKNLASFSKTLGLNQNKKIKQTLLLIILVYLGYGLIVFSSLFFTGKVNIINSICLAFAAISTGGFSPTGELNGLLLNRYVFLSLTGGMILGASNFLIFLNLLKLKIKDFVKSEVGIFLLMIAFLPFLFKVISGLSLSDSFFNFISAMTNTGFQYTDIAGLVNKSKIFLSCAMFIGGTSLSTAGGIKILRLLILFKAAKYSINLVNDEIGEPISIFGRYLSNEEVIQSLIIVLAFAGTIAVSTFLISSPSINLTDSLFEITSAITNTGLSVGITNINMLLGSKWIFIIVMLLGRIEILAFFIMLSKRKKTRTFS